MDSSAADDEAALATTNTGAHVWPALRLWLCYEVLWGAWWLLVSFAEEPASLICVAGYLVVSASSYVLIGAWAWRDRVSCRIFARPRRGMVELCVVAGVAGAFLLAMLEQHIRGWHVDPLVWEKGLGWPCFASFVSIAVLPAVFEELLFRGVLLQRLRCVLSLPQAIAVQAMLFALMHLDGAYALPHFAFGCLAGFLRSAAGALWPCILFHFLWNGWLVLERFEWL